MTGVSLPVSRPTRRALVIANSACRTQLLGVLHQMQFPCAEIDDPYAAMLELCRHPIAYRSLIISLMSVYPGELAMIQAVKRHFPHIEVWLAHSDGRHAALAEGLRLGADGLLTDDGLHRTAMSSPTAATQPSPVMVELPAAPPPEEPPNPFDAEVSVTDPVLTPEELRALLQEQPSMPPGNG